MTKRTLYVTEIVKKEYMGPRRSEIIKRIKAERAIAAGINLGTVVVTAMMIAKVAVVVYETLISRTGAAGGEILVLPALAMMFYWGFHLGSQNNGGNEWEALEDHGEQGNKGC